MFYEKTVLPGGLRVVTEEIPFVRSVSVGVWVGAGSLWESDAQQGVSHFIEHMLFKGTASRSARQISQEIDGRGGSLNAYTTREQTCYYAKVLDSHFSIAVDVLADMLQASRFDPADIEKEKGVILEEIKMYEDVPDDVVHDVFSQALWPGHPLGRPIVGTVDTVQALTREGLLQYMAGHYTPTNTVVAAAGNVKHAQVMEAVAAAFARLGGEQAEPPPQPYSLLPGNVARLRPKETEQLHIVAGCLGLPQEHDDVYALYLLNTILGGGPASRLFQEIREERGLAYSVYTYHQSFRDTGLFAVYAGISPGQMDPVLAVIHEELQKFGEQGATEEELHEAKEQVKGQIMLSLESTSGRMTRIGRGELSLTEVLSPDQIIARIESVTLEQTARLARQLLLQQPRVLAMVGPLRREMDLASHGFDHITWDREPGKRGRRRK